jgi:hypothetical protein
VTQPSIDLEHQYHVGQLVELHAEICTAPCESDCGCREMVARNGHQGAVLNVQPPLSRLAGVPYYQVDGLDWVVYGDELRTVEP